MSFTSRILRWIFPVLFLGVVNSWAALPEVELGIDVLAAHQFHGLEGKRVGLLTNQTGVNRLGHSTIEVLKKSVNLVALYAPEHGLYGAELAGESVANTVDVRTGLPAYSLHGATRKPTPSMLKGIDVLVFDLQDIGCRSYTYISTMGLAMEAAGEAGIEFWVLDRPNPLGGDRVEGMPLDPKFRSFVGQWDIPYVYGLTCGELAKMIHEEKWITKRPKLTIVPMRGWKREMTWAQTGLTWVPTSPHIPTAETAYHYVITGLIGELGIVSTGVGYTQPFELIGSPKFKAFDLSDAMNRRELPGFYFRPAFYTPFYGSLKGQRCEGVQTHLIEPNSTNLVNLAMIFMEEIRARLGVGLFDKVPPEKIGLYDKVCGSDAVRKHFTGPGTAAAIIDTWKSSLEAFRLKRQPYLLYKKEPPVPVVPATPPVPAPTAPVKPKGKL